MKLKIYADEAGRGPLAGPVVVGLTMPLESIEDENIFDDSKKLSEKKRNIIYQKIKDLEKNKNLLYSFGYATNKEIDNFGITKSINIAFKRGLIILLYKYIINYTPKNGDTLLSKTKLVHKLNIILKNIENIQNYDFKEIIHLFSEIKKIHGIIFDGNHDFGLSKELGYKIITVIKGDSKIPYIGAASIIAKVERDNFMIEQGKKYPNFLFEKHKGYGTKEHRELIKKYGPTPLHRKSFLRNII